jgi:hypothetical protein
MSDFRGGRGVKNDSKKNQTSFMNDPNYGIYPRFVTIVKIILNMGSVGSPSLEL